MSFLNPLLLFGLPLISLPILIHLINRQRHRSIPWGAMMFLLDAKRLQRNMAKLRYWLIMAMRMLAIGGLVFAASRPLSSGWIGTAVGNRADTVLVLLDRSPSMEQQNPLTGQSKRETALTKLQDLLQKTGEGKRVLLIENTRVTAEEIPPNQLNVLPEVTGTDVEADIPRMLQCALDYLVSNEVGQADIWIASDLRRNDWREEDGRWSALRDGFSKLEGIRFHLLTYGQRNVDNLSVSVGSVRKRQSDDSPELLLDVTVRREGTDQGPQTVPLEFVVNGARSVLEVEMASDEFTLQGHVIPIDASVEAGWGRVDLPGDTNPADNSYFFTFANEAVRSIPIVSDDPDAIEPVRIASAASPDPGIDFVARVLPVARIGEIDWDRTTFLVWHSPLPGGTVATQLNSFLRKGRPVLFLPPEAPGTGEILGARWGEWVTATAQTPVGISSWDNDADLLARTRSGVALPVGKQSIARYCKLNGVGRSLARLTNGDPLLWRADGTLPAYFLATLPNVDSSSLARDGVVLYVMTQRAIELGAKQQGSARQVDAGTVDPAIVSQWDVLSSLPAEIASSQRAFHAACYNSGDDQWTAVNRPLAEDSARFVDKETLDKLFSGLDYHQITDEVGGGSALANEIWRVFLVLMALALITEAALCLG